MNRNLFYFLMQIECKKCLSSCFVILGWANCIARHIDQLLNNEDLILVIKFKEARRMIKKIAIHGLILQNLTISVDLQFNQQKVINFLLIDEKCSRGILSK